MTDTQDNNIVLIDEEGAEHQFEIIDMLEVEGANYAVLFPVEEEDGDEAIILKAGADENGEEVLFEIEDDEEWEKVADIYQEMVEEE